MVNTLRRRVQPFVSVAPSVVTLAVCCTLSTVASQRPRRRQEVPTYGRPLRGPDGPGARHHVGVPHLRDQPHPLLQLPRRGHDGERRAVRPEDAAAAATARGGGNSYINRQPRWRACHHSSMSHTTSRKTKKTRLRSLSAPPGGRSRVLAYFLFEVVAKCWFCSDLMVLTLLYWYTFILAQVVKSG